MSEQEHDQGATAVAERAPRKTPTPVDPVFIPISEAIVEQAAKRAFGQKGSKWDPIIDALHDTPDSWAVIAGFDSEASNAAAALASRLRKMYTEVTFLVRRPLAGSNLPAICVMASYQSTPVVAATSETAVTASA